MRAPDSLQPSEGVAPTSLLYFFLHIYILAHIHAIVAGQSSALCVFSCPVPFMGSIKIIVLNHVGNLSPLTEELLLLVRQ